MVTNAFELIKAWKAQCSERSIKQIAVLYRPWRPQIWRAVAMVAVEADWALSSRPALALCDGIWLKGHSSYFVCCIMMMNSQTSIEVTPLVQQSTVSQEVYWRRNTGTWYCWWHYSKLYPYTKKQCVVMIDPTARVMPWWCITVGEPALVMLFSESLAIGKERIWIWSQLWWHSRSIGGDDLRPWQYWLIAELPDKWNLHVFSLMNNEGAA